MGHETVDCPVLFYTDANNDLIDWVNSTMGKVWAAEGFNEYDTNTKLPGYKVRYLNRLQSEFTKAMLKTFACQVRKEQDKESTVF